jgi:hypothetical protein
VFNSVTVASDIPVLTRIGGERQLTIEGRVFAPDEQPPSVGYLYIGPRYFEILGLPRSMAANSRTGTAPQARKAEPTAKRYSLGTTRPVDNRRDNTPSGAVRKNSLSTDRVGAVAKLRGQAGDEEAGCWLSNLRRRKDNDERQAQIARRVR